MDLSLNNREWKEYLFPDIFDIKKGYYNKKPISSKKGTIPFLSATQFNNGVSEFYTLSEIENASKTGNDKNDHSTNEKIFEGNCITVTNDGSVGYAFYQKVDFTCSHSINPLYLKNYTLNSILAKFLITTIEAQRICFEYARKWRPQRMEKSKILLPTTSKGEPDYQFMEQFMLHKEQQKQNEYQQFIQKKISQLKNTPKTVSLDEKEWGGFELESIFNINSGVRLTKADMKEGNTPFIGATDSNNGITEFVSNTNNSEDKNVLGVNYNGSVVENFYHPYIAIFTDDVKRLSLKNIEGNEFLYLFIKTTVLKQKIKYRYGYKFNATRMKRQKIMLPINNNNQPDYEFMENYMRNIELKKLTEYLKFKKMSVPAIG